MPAHPHPRVGGPGFCIIVSTYLMRVLAGGLFICLSVLHVPTCSRSCLSRLKRLERRALPNLLPFDPQPPAKGRGRLGGDGEAGGSTKGRLPDRTDANLKRILSFSPIKGTFQ